MRRFLSKLPRFREASREVEQLAKNELWSASEIADYQLQRINSLWRHAIVCVPYYRELAEKTRLPPRFESLTEYVQLVPILEKSEVRRSPQKFLSAQPHAGSWKRTGGSTGDPLRVYWGYQSHREMLWAKYRMEQSFGLHFLDRKAFLWGHEGSFATGLAGRAQRWQQRATDRLRQRLRLNAYRLGAEELSNHVRSLQRFCPASLYGYSSAIYALSKHCLNHQAGLGSLGLCILTAEPAHAFMLESVSAAFGCRAAIEYGSVECGIIATGSPDGSLRIREDRVFVETHPEPGGQWAIVVTVLNNPSFPLLRYRIEDQSCQSVDRPNIGFAKLSCVLGRNNDVLIGRRGTIIHSMAIKHVLEADPAIRRFQATQSADGSLDVLIEPIQNNASLNLNRVFLHLTNLVEGYPVTMSVTDQIPGNLAGKHRWIRSEI